MKYIGREQKGTYGYIRKQVIFELIKTIILFAMAFGIFCLGYMTLHTKKSLWSVFAVLALLPASKSLVGLIMLARFSSLSEDEYKRYSSAAGSFPALFETVMTTSEKAYYIPVMFYAANTVTALVRCKGADVAKLREHFEEVLKTGGHNSAVRLFDDEDQFLERAGDMREKYSGNDLPKPPAVFDTIKAVSL